MTLGNMEKRCCIRKKNQTRRGMRHPSGLTVRKRNLRRIHPNRSGGKNIFHLISLEIQNRKIQQMHFAYLTCGILCQRIKRQCSNIIFYRESRSIENYWLQDEISFFNSTRPLNNRCSHKVDLFTSIKRQFQHVLSCLCTFSL